MPQLEQIHTFASQLFWLVVTFAALYFFLRAVALPKITSVLEQRQSRISADLEKAALLKDEAEGVLAEYEKAAEEGRAKAQAAIREAQEELSAEAAKRHDALGEKLAKQVREAEERIAKEREDALKNIRDVAVDLAQAATERLVGAKIDAKSAQTAVDAAMKERR